MNLNGKRIVLLGGTAGIGLATAAAAAREGAVVVVASSDSGAGCSCCRRPAQGDGGLHDQSVQ